MVLEAQQDQGLPDQKHPRPFGLHEALPEDRERAFALPGDRGGLEVAGEGVGAALKPQLLSPHALAGCY